MSPVPFYGSFGGIPEEIDSQTGTFTLPELGTPFCAANASGFPSRKTFSDLLQISAFPMARMCGWEMLRTLIKNKTCTISEVIGTRDSIMTYLLLKGPGA